MTGRAVFENAHAVVRYFSDEGIVEVEFKQRVVGPGLREVLDVCAAQLKKGRCQKLLADNRKLGVIDEADERWSGADWLPRMLAAGWKYWAVVNPEKSVGQLQTARHVKGLAPLGVKVSSHATPELARAWLKAADAALRRAG